MVGIPVHIPVSYVFENQFELANDTQYWIYFICFTMTYSSINKEGHIGWHVSLILRHGGMSMILKYCMYVFRSVILKVIRFSHIYRIDRHSSISRNAQVHIIAIQACV
jgi:hypothetical protein